MKQQKLVTANIYLNPGLSKDSKVMENTQELSREMVSSLTSHPAQSHDSSSKKKLDKHFLSKTLTQSSEQFNNYLNKAPPPKPVPKSPQVEVLDVQES
mgnify:CR=1 FL=1